MTDLEKVIDGLKHHAEGRCRGKDDWCPYYSDNDYCCNNMLNDAITLLKAQEPCVMTFEELHNYVSKQLGVVMQNEDDWRPAGDMYIKDIVKVIDGVYTTIPNGIRIWLKNGDSIIYVKAQVETNDPN